MIINSLINKMASNIFGSFDTIQSVTVNSTQEVLGKKRFLNPDNEFAGTMVQPSIEAVNTTISPEELSYLDGVTGNIQAQFGNYLTLAQANTNYLGRLGTPTSLASVTTFNGAVTMNALSATTGAFSDLVAINFTSAGADNGRRGITLRDATNNNSILMIPSNSSGNLNGFANPGASAIVSVNGTQGSQALELYPWSGTTVGLRLTGSSALIGAGGTASFLPTSSISFSGTTATMAGGLSMPSGSISITDGTNTNNITALGYTTRNSVQNATHYLNFSDSSGTGTGAIQKAASISCNPSTGTITCTNLNGLASSATLSSTSSITNDGADAGFFPVYVSASGSQGLKIKEIGAQYTVNPNTGHFYLSNTMKVTSTNVAFGASSGIFQDPNCIAIGPSAGNSQGNSAIAIGNTAGSQQGLNSIAMGKNAGQSQGNNAVAVGNEAGKTNQGTGSLALGYLAGALGQLSNGIAIGQAACQFGQNIQAIAIGTNAANGAVALQGQGAIAIGSESGKNGQGTTAVAIGLEAGNSNQGTDAVAIGTNAGRTTQGINSVAIGYGAGNNTQGTGSVAIGLNAGLTTQGASSVAIGASTAAVQGVNSVAIGASTASTSQGANSVAIGANAATTQGDACVAIGQGAGTSQAGNNVAIGNGAGATQLASAVAIGRLAGTNSAANTVAIGSVAAEQGQLGGGIAIGFAAGRYTQQANAVAIGNNAGVGTVGGNFQGTGAVAIGLNAGLGTTTSQGAYAVAIGPESGKQGQGTNTVAVGYNAGQSNQAGSAVAIGVNAGVTNQASSAVAIGNTAGNNTQAGGCVAVGNSAGASNQVGLAVAVGQQAGQTSQGNSAVAMGYLSGASNQSTGGVAIGRNAAQGTVTGQGTNAIAIGSFAGQNSQVANSICLNASGSALNPANAGFYVDPIRAVFATNEMLSLSYNGSTKEILASIYPDFFGPTITGAGTLAVPLGRNYLINAATSYAITLPNPGDATNAKVTFRRSANTQQVTFTTAGGGNSMVQITNNTSVTQCVMSNLQFATTLICNGTLWYQVHLQ